MGPRSGIRAQSSVIGYVLIIGMVVTSATLIAFAGADVMNQYREMVGQESTTNSVEQIDTELSSVASVGGLTRAEFSVGDAQPSQYRIVRSGHINVTANENASCRAHIPLSSLRFDRGDGVVVAYEAGGIWRQQGGLVNQTAMHTPPDVLFKDGTLSMTVVNVSGKIEGSENIVNENASKSIEANNAIQDALFNGKCARPNNVTISVKSTFYRGWDGYFRSSINASSYSIDHENHTARVVLDQDVLPEETDDERNDVVNLNDSAASYMDELEVKDNSIKINKSANNTYTVIVTPLSSGSTQVGQIRTVEDDTAFRPPIDVVFVVDESGSMQEKADGSGSICYTASCVSKGDEAKNAARAFVGQMNDSYDRAGVVGFNDTGFIHNTAGGEYITDDFGSPGPYTTDGVNGSINSLASDDGTNMGAGIHDANVLFGLQSNSSRNKVMILLGDGENSEDEYREAAFDEAEIADKEGITIHTVGFGDLNAQANQTMRDVAQTTGGTYQYVDDASTLSEVFVELFAEISASKQIVRDPFSLELDADGTTYYPQIDGSTDHIANGTNGEFNLNDPTAPTNFSYSIDVEDGENVSMTALDYECEEWTQTGNSYENESNGQVYAEVRCVDINESTRTPITPSNTSVFVDGEDVSPLLDQPSNWWDRDLKNETLKPYLGGPNNETLDLKSNQALVVFEFEDDDGAKDRLLVLYRIGESEQDAVPKHIFNLEVRYLEIGNKD